MGKITLQVDTTGYSGFIRKHAKVETNDPENAQFQIYLKAEVTPIFVIKPWSRVLMSTSVGRPAAQTLTLTNSLDHPVEITGLKNPLADIMDARLVTIEKGREYELIVNLKAESQTKQTGDIILSLSGVELPELKIPANVNIWVPTGQRVPSKPKTGSKAGG